LFTCGLSQVQDAGQQGTAPHHSWECSSKEWAESTFSAVLRHPSKIKIVRVSDAAVLRRAATGEGVWGTASLSSRVKVMQIVVESKAVQIMKDGRNVPAVFRELRLEIPFPSGKTGPLEILMLHEPGSGSFWWQYQSVVPGQASHQLSDFTGRSVVYITGNRVVTFSFSRPSIWVGESTEHYATMSDGQASVLAQINEQSTGDRNRNRSSVVS
jgi:hypothetical protein